MLSDEYDSSLHHSESERKSRDRQPADCFLKPGFLTFSTSFEVEEAAELLSDLSESDDEREDDKSEPDMREQLIYTCSVSVTLTDLLLSFR